MTGEERDRIRQEAQQDYAFTREDAAERVRIQASLADRALQALLISNGGALIALFSFVAGSASLKLTATGLRWTFALFVCGLFLGLVAHLLAFMSQDRFMHSSFEQMQRFQRIMHSGEWEEITQAELNPFRHGAICYYFGLGLAMLSMISFAAGCGTALFSLAG